MTTFENLELIYNEFLSVSDEVINLCVNKEDYDTAIDKIEQKNNAMKKLIIARKTSSLTEEEQAKINLLDEKIRQNEEHLLEFLKENKTKIKNEIDITKKRVRISSAYVIPTIQKQGVHLNIEE